MNGNDNSKENQIVKTGASSIAHRSERLASRGLQEASFKPDLGIRLLAEGTSDSDDLIFPNLGLYTLSILSSGQYSTTVFIPYDGETYALTVDFNEAQLNEILLKASTQVRNQIKAQLGFDSVTVRSFVLDEFVPFGVRARLGNLKQVERERFIPLIVQEILDEP